MSSTPLHDLVLVRSIEGEEATKVGLIIPDSAKERPQEGEVVSVGAGGRRLGCEHIPMDVKSGDRILFGESSGSEIKFDGEDVPIMKESGIFGVIACVHALPLQPQSQELRPCPLRKLDSAPTPAIVC
jgi:chaperonin GroES